MNANEQDQQRHDVGATNETANPCVAIKSRGASFDVNFVQSAHLMLEECSQNHADIITWTKEGDAVEVRDIGALESTILPRYFNSNKYSTFVRQLNKYDFQRRKPDQRARKEATTNVVLDIFSHKSFRKGQRDLLSKIKRKEIQGGSTTNNKRRLAGEEEIQSFKKRLRFLEEGQAQILSSVKRLEEVLVGDEPLLRQLAPSGGDDTIQRLEGSLESVQCRLRSVESALFTISTSNQRYHDGQRKAGSSQWRIAPSSAADASSEQSVWGTRFPSLQRSPSSMSYPVLPNTDHTYTVGEAYQAQAINQYHQMKDLSPPTATAEPEVAGRMPPSLSRDNTFDSKIRNMQNLDVDMIMDHPDA